MERDLLMARDKKGKQWDGRSRVSNDTYRKRFNEIFKKKEKTLNEELMEGFEKEQKDLEESYKQSIKNKKRNPVAKQLRHFKQKVVKNKKAYDRKNYGKTSRHNEDSHSTQAAG